MYLVTIAPIQLVNGKPFYVYSPVTRIIEEDLYSWWREEKWRTDPDFASFHDIAILFSYKIPESLENRW